jgi:DEAD/DEAH box helicase domain-containing protein
VNHLKCAAFELPFGTTRRSATSTSGRELAALEDEGLLHRAGSRYHWASRLTRPTTSRCGP